MTGRLLERRLLGRTLGNVALLDAVTVGDRSTLFFNGPAPAGLVAGNLLAEGSIGGGSMLAFTAGTVTVAGAELTTAQSEQELMAGRNVLAATRNGESAEAVLEWLTYHHGLHGAGGAVILDRARPGEDPGFAAALTKGLAQLDMTVILLSSDLPLGKPNKPPEAHPLNIPESPGKDRMDIPPADPWRSLLGAMTVYEIMRLRFLARARAVANIDVHDLILPGAQTVFDSARAANSGLIALEGQHVYPWRVRKGKSARFGDHICVQFDGTHGRRRWCIAPDKSPAQAVWRLVRVGNATPDPAHTRQFVRHMALRHPTPSVSKIVPKSSLIEHPPLLEMAEKIWDHSPVRMPESTVSTQSAKGRRAIVTTMKNEAPFILEWLAYHRAIGFDDILVYTNDCTDGTDTMLALLQEKGLVQHRENPFRGTDLKPQHAALQAAEKEPVIRNAAWVTCIDVDEFITIKCGDGTLDALFAAVPEANLISMTWRLFGNNDVHAYEDRPITEQFHRCAPELIRKPHQAWGFKTLFHNLGLFKKLGVHRPKGLKPQLWEEIRWVNGSGKALPPEMYRNAWRSTASTYGYDLVQLNHYAVRSAESFLVKRDRGRVNHVDRDQGLAYWFRMNNNGVEDHAIARMLPKLRDALDKLLDDPEIAAAHAHGVDCHTAKIEELRATENYARFYRDLTSPRMEKLSRLHGHFGANVFLSGPEVVPDEVVARDPGAEWFFTVERSGEAEH